MSSNLSSKLSGNSGTNFLEPKNDSTDSSSPVVPITRCDEENAVHPPQLVDTDKASRINPGDPAIIYFKKSLPLDRPVPVLVEAVKNFFRAYSNSSTANNIHEDIAQMSLTEVPRCETIENVQQELKDDKKRSMNPDPIQLKRNGDTNTHTSTKNAHGPPKKEIHFVSGFTKTRRYKHIYFDDDGNVIDDNPQVSNTSSSIAERTNVL
ncbi:hypothetical protein Bhyg_00523 [Pseudolycoriella hygida]|uniref:Uncharacterized protein n=1 Tax=Pseudolycoriella hygida TaxID=35572 RepID=A0A9Q0N7Q1_9DIPT|nr:hypothetical protein Bhyg_00523 [Pseudolycoriella hygida]